MSNVFRIFIQIFLEKFLIVYNIVNIWRIYAVFYAKCDAGTNSARETGKKTKSSARKKNNNPRNKNMPRRIKRAEKGNHLPVPAPTTSAAVQTKRPHRRADILSTKNITEVSYEPDR